MVLITDSKAIVNAAKSVVNACEKQGLKVPRLEDILKALVASKLCPRTWKSVVQSVAPGIASHMRQLTENDADLHRELQNKAIVALHIMTLADVSKNAAKNGDFMKFSQHMGFRVPSTLSQMMYFTLGSLDNNRSHLWHSNLMSHALQMSESQISAEVLPKIDAFAANCQPDRLSESYSQLLSGIAFDLDKLDPMLMKEADFPCQRPVQPKEDKQALRAEVYYLGEDLLRLKLGVDPRILTQKDVDDFEHLKLFNETANDRTRRPEIRENLTLAQTLKTKFEKHQLQEHEMCANLRKTIDEKHLAFNRAKEKINHKALDDAGLGHGPNSILLWELPADFHMDKMSSKELRSVLTEIERKLNLINRFKK